KPASEAPSIAKKRLRPGAEQTGQAYRVVRQQSKCLKIDPIPSKTCESHPYQTKNIRHNFDTERVVRTGTCSDTFPIAVEFDLPTLVQPRSYKRSLAFLGEPRSC